MSTIADLKTAVKDILHLNLNVTDSFQGEASSNDVDDLIDRSILRAANNARLWAERRHDFAENDVSIRLTYLDGKPVPLVGVDDRLEFERGILGYGGRLEITGATTGRFYSYYGKQLTNTGRALLANVYDSSDQDDNVTVVHGNPDAFVSLTGVDNVKVQGKLGFYDNYMLFQNFSSASGTGLYRLKTLHNAFLVETEGYRPLHVRGRKAMIHRSRRQLDLEEADPYFRYPDDDVSETRPVYFVYDGVFGRLMPEQNGTVVLEGNAWMAPYTGDADTDFLLDKGFDFMMWQTVLEINHITQTFVARQEGTLSPPERARDFAWQALIEHDEYRFDGNAHLDIG